MKRAQPLLAWKTTSEETPAGRGSIPKIALNSVFTNEVYLLNDRR
jgi:hypothetical protein